MKLRYSRFVDADFGADLLHGDVAVVIEGDDFLFAGRQRLDGMAHSILELGALVGGIGRLRF